MQVSIKWLKDYVDIDETAEQIADRLTMAGVPVERIVRADEGLEKVITARIEKITPHPDSDHLFVCQLDIGKEERIQIVTGASNVREGHIVPAAMVGAVLPDGKKISKGKLRGVPSNGMMCSAGELAINTEDAEAVRTVRRQLELEHDIIQPQCLGGGDPDGRILRQDVDAMHLLVGQPLGLNRELARRAHHAV